MTSPHTAYTYTQQDILDTTEACIQLIDAGMIESFESILAELKAAVPQCPEVLLLDGIKALNNERNVDAISHFMLLLRNTPDMPMAHFYMGRALAAEGDIMSASDYFLSCVKLMPDYAEAYAHRAEMLTLQGEYDEAYATLLQALSINTGDSTSWRALPALLPKLSMRTEYPGLEDIVIKALRSHDVLWRDITMVILYILPTKHYCEALIAIDSPSEMEKALLDGEALSWFSEPLLACCLQYALIASPKYDLALQYVRSALLNIIAEKRYAPDKADMFFEVTKNLATYCYNNEYIFYETPEDTEQLSALKKHIASLESSDSIDDALAIAITACFTPLIELPDSQRLSKTMKASHNEALITLSELVIDNLQKERDLLGDLPSFSEKIHESSRKEQEQYEEYPYPRWLTLAPAKPIAFRIGVGAEMPYLKKDELPNIPEQEDGNFDILVAGCGTGQHPLNLARAYPNAHVYAMDYSRPCIAYALMKAEELNVKNIELSYGDILELDALNKQFDVVECGGVIHHMPEIEKAIQSLADSMKPGGWMKLATYDYYKRDQIREAWDYVKNHGYGSDKNELKRLRYDWLRNPPENEMLRQLTRQWDFYSLSNCNGLLFHFGEHQLRLTTLGEMIDKIGLMFEGLVVQNAAEWNKLNHQEPLISDRHSYAEWEEVQKKHPTLFHHMHIMYLSKPAD